MAINLPYKLREGQIAYAAKVMANFEALLGAYNNGSVPGLGDGDIYTLLSLMYSAAVLANEAGNAEQIRFGDGETLVQKFSAGTLNAALLDNEGLFYCEVKDDGHLYITASDGIEQGDFSIGSDGHLTYMLSDPATNNSVHVYDLGNVKGDPDRILGYFGTLASLQATITEPANGDKYAVGTAAPYDIYVYDARAEAWINNGPTGYGDMTYAVYDPNRVEKDVNFYTGYYALPVAKWGGYFLTYDATFDENKTYYTYDSVQDTYSEATVTAGADVLINTYYERLPSTDCLLTDAEASNDVLVTDHITATTGHALMGPAPTATDAAKLDWSAGVITAVGQGSGLDAEGAENNSSWIRLRALGSVPTNAINLMVSFYL